MAKTSLSEKDIRLKNHIFEQIDEIRKSKGLTNAQLAEMIGVTNANFSVTRSKQSCTIDMLVRIVNALECTLVLLPENTEEEFWKNRLSLIINK